MKKVYTFILIDRQEEEILNMIEKFAENPKDTVFQETTIGKDDYGREQTKIKTRKTNINEKVGEEPKKEEEKKSE